MRGMRSCSQEVRYRGEWRVRGESEGGKKKKEDIRGMGDGEKENERKREEG